MWRGVPLSTEGRVWRGVEAGMVCGGGPISAEGWGCAPSQENFYREMTFWFILGYNFNIKQPNTHVHVTIDFIITVAHGPCNGWMT